MLARFSRVSVGSLYNAEALEKSVEEMQIEASRRGFAFAIVKPRGDRNFESHTVSIVFAVDEGPRTYIERINVRGNTRTRDYVIRREFDISEGDAYNRALVDRAERRLKNLDFFKTVKIMTEPGSSSDRVILNVDLEEKSTGDFSVSGGYSTTDGPLAEVSISERNLLGRGLFGKASVTYGEFARGVSLSYVDPYLLDYRVALGLDAYYREQLPNLYIAYGTKTVGFSPRLGLTLREDLSLQLRYSIYEQKSRCRATSTIVTTNSRTSVQSVAGLREHRGGSGTNSVLVPSIPPAPVCVCYADGEASLPVRKELASANDYLGSRLYVGLQYARQQQEPDRRSVDRLEAGLRRRRRRRDLSEVGGRREVLYADGGRYRRRRFTSRAVCMTQIGNNAIRMLDQFQMGPNLVRGFAPNGIGPRDINRMARQDALGGTKYWGASLEFQMPFWFLPKEMGLKGAVYADAGWLCNYKGPTDWAATGEVNRPGCIPPTNNGLLILLRPEPVWDCSMTSQNVVRSCGRRGPDLAVAVRSASL